MSRSPELARRLYHRFEPIHAVTYFAPEAHAALADLGYPGFWMGYFAARSAPLGRVGAAVVTAVFYNFAPWRVAKALPAAWEIAGPEAVLRAREDSAVEALRRCGITDDESVRAAADLAGKAARYAPIDGRALFAANAELPWPDEPVAALWHATTLLREHRGDTHVAVLTAEGISGRDANVFHVAAGRVSREFITRSRDYDEATWREHEESLASRGLLDADGSLTADGARLKEHIEAATDRLAMSALDGLTDSEVDTLFATLTPLTRQVVATGDIPATTPMGLARDDLADDRGLT